MLDVIAAAARMYLAIVILGAVIGLVGLIVSPTTTINDIPVGIEWPTSLPCDDPGGSATTNSLYCAWIPTANAEITPPTAASRRFSSSAGCSPT